MIALTPQQVEKPWGRTHLPAPFGGAYARPVGEVWFDPPPAVDRLLAKYIFAAQNLSIQLHPNDAQAAELSGAASMGGGGMGAGRGKEECWLIVSADPGAAVGIGFREAIGPEAMRRAALDGSIEDLLVWHPVAPGDFFYIPANTVHAIGGGVGLVEIQQNSDITYRLYDYGRPRALHLDQAIPIAHGGPHPAQLRRRVPATGEHWLVDGPKFALLRYHGALSEESVARIGAAPCLILPLEGAVSESGCRIDAGGAGLVQGIAAVAIAEGATGLIALPLE